MEVQVRLADANDAEALAKLNQLFNGGDRRSAQEIAESMRESSEIIAVAEMDGRVVGFGCAQSFRSFCYKEPLGEITEMYVEEAFRRMGAATALLSCLEMQLRKRGVTEVKVLTGRRNHSAIRTYKRCQYEEDDEQLLKKQLT